MHRLRNLRSITVVLAVVLALAPATAAFATPPTFETIPLAETWEFAAGERCDFPIRGETTGRLVIKHHYDREGNLVFDKVTFVQWSIRVSNAETGETLFTAGPEPTLVTYHQDGSITYAFMGLSLHVVVPGEGLVAAGVGRIVFEITFENGVPEEEIVFEAGMHGVDVGQAACEALEP
jgi:hypothetical protein